MSDYESLLNTAEWRQKRAEIVARDRDVCQRCGETGIPIEVHHRYYMANTQPWEYDNDALVSVCRPCHKVIHQTESIPFLDRDGNLVSKCGRCEGSGYIPKFNHVENGVCFKCYGAGFSAEGFAWQLSAFKKYNAERMHSAEQMPVREIILPEFKVGSIHINRKGPYIIEAVKGGCVTIRYADGKRGNLRVDVLERIEKEILSVKRVVLKEDEAVDYIKRNNLKLESDDSLLIYDVAYKHLERNK